MKGQLECPFDSLRAFIERVFGIMPIDDPETKWLMTIGSTMMAKISKWKENKYRIHYNLKYSKEKLQMLLKEKEANDKLLDRRLTRKDKKQHKLKEKENT